MRRKRRLVALAVVGVDECEHRGAGELLGTAPDDAAEARVGEGDAAAEVGVDDARRRLRDDGAKERFRLVQRLADPTPVGDVDEGEDDAADPVVAGPVRPQPRQQPAIAEADLALDRCQLVEHRVRVVGELRIVEPAREVADRPADVGGDQVEELDRRRSEERDPQRPVEKERRDRARRHQVLQVGVGSAQLVDLALQLLVDGGQLLVDRLQLLAAGLELLGRRAQLLVHRLQLFVARLQLLRRDVALLGRVAQVPLQLVDLLLQHVDARLRRRPVDIAGRAGPGSDSGVKVTSRKPGAMSSARPTRITTASSPPAPKASRAVSMPSSPPWARSSAVRRSAVSDGWTASSTLLVGSPAAWWR
jgi:hypothetical protein